MRQNESRIGGGGARVWAWSWARVEKVLEHMVSRHCGVSAVSVLRAGLLGRGKSIKNKVGIQGSSGRAPDVTRCRELPIVSSSFECLQGLKKG